MDWFEIFLKHAPDIIKCVEKFGKAKTYTRLRSGNFWVSIKLWREARQAGFRGKEARDQVQIGRAELAMLTDEQYDEGLADMAETIKSFYEPTSAA